MVVAVPAPRREVDAAPIEKEVAEANKDAQDRKKAYKGNRILAPAEAVPDEVEEVAALVVTSPPPSKKTLRRRERKAALRRATELKEEKQRKTGDDENERIRRACDAACEDAPRRKDGQVVDDPTHGNMKALRAALLADEKKVKAQAKAKAAAKASAEAVDVYTSVFSWGLI